jgi:phosphoribosyl 1,2-cyclic phosphate phosphodiesterase
MIACDCAVCSSMDVKDKRYRSSVLIESDTTSIVIDTTPDFRSQMLRADVKKLDAVLFTHAHKDHVAGLDDIRAFNYFHQRPMKVYATALTQKAIKNEFHYVFSDQKYPGVPQISLHEITDEEFLIGDITVTPIQVWHLNMPVLGFRFGNFVYITDANRIEDSQQAKISGAKIIVLNALRKEKHVSHFNLQEAIALVHQLKIPQAYFTHISHQLGKHEIVSRELPPGISLAYDTLQLISS